MCVNHFGAAVALSVFMPAVWLVAADQVVLGTSNAAGQKTRLSITNRSSSSAQAKLWYFGPAGAPAVEPVDKTIPPMATLVIGDVLGELWGLTDQHGAVQISGDQPLLVIASRHTESAAGGRAGSQLPVLFKDDVPASGATADLLWIAEDEDRSAGRSASIDVYTASEGTEVEIAVFDSTGSRIAAQTLQSGSGYHQIQLSSLVEVGLKVARAEVKVKSGRAVATLELTDNATGQRSTIASLDAGAEGRAFTLTPAFQRTNLRDSLLRSDMRLLNPGGSAATVTLQFGGDTRTLDLAPKAMVEVTDVLESLFAAGEGAQGPLSLQATVPVIASFRAISRSVTADGGEVPAVDYVDVRAAATIQPLFTTGAAGVIGGLRAAGAHLFLSARAGEAFDARADLVLRDTDGQSVAGAVLDVEKSKSGLFALADLFPGVSIPNDGILEVQSLAGDLDLEILSVDNITGDVNFLGAQPSVIDVPCSRPEISFVNSSARNLTAPGDVTINWATRLADTVTIEPGPATLPASSSHTVRVTASGEYRLVARNACGETAATIGISVGPPQLQSIAVLGTASASGGQPGQLFALNLANVGDVGGLSGLILREGTRIEKEIPLAGFSEDGVAYARIPLLPDPTVPAGYRTGHFTLSVVVDGVEGPPLALTIEPLPVVADPVTQFRALLDSIAAAGASWAAELATVSGDSQGAQTALSTAGRMEAELRSMLAAIATTGSGTLNLGMPAAGAPPAPTVTVTRADLAAILALNANYLASVGSAALTAREKSASSPQRNAGTCIKDKEPYITVCKSIEDTMNGLWLLVDPHPQVFNNDELDQAIKLGRDATVKYVTKKIQESALNAAVSKVNLMLNWTNLLCALQPIRLKRFDVIPTEFPIGYPRGLTIAAELRAVLEPKYKEKEIVDELVKEETKKFMDQIPAKHKFYKPVIEPAIKSAVQSLYGGFDNEVAAFIRQYLPGVKGEATYQVGKCDIARFYAKRNGPNESEYDPAKAILIPVYTSDPSWGRDSYYFQGKRRGPETMCIRPFDSHFLLSRALTAKFQQSPQLRGSMCEFQTGPVTGGRFAAGPAAGPRPDLIPTRVLVHAAEVNVSGTPKLAVTSSNLNAWCVCADQERVGAFLQGSQYQGNAAITDSTPYVTSFPWRNSRADVRVSKVAERTWEATVRMNSVRQPQQSGGDYHDALARVSFSFTNPGNRDNTQSIGVEVTQLPGCEAPASFTGFVSGVGGSGGNIFQLPANPFRPFTKRYYTGVDRGSLMLTIGGVLSGFPNGTTNCTMTARIEMLDGPPPVQPTP